MAMKTFEEICWECFTHVALPNNHILDILSIISRYINKYQISNDFLPSIMYYDILVYLKKCNASMDNHFLENIAINFCNQINWSTKVSQFTKLHGIAEDEVIEYITINMKGLNVYNYSEMMYNLRKIGRYDVNAYFSSSLGANDSDLIELKVHNGC